MSKNKYEEPKVKGFVVTYYRSFPSYMKIKCPKCGEEEYFSLRFERENKDNKELKEEMKLIKKYF